MAALGQSASEPQLGGTQEIEAYNSMALYASPSYSSIYADLDDLEPGPGSYDIPGCMGWQALSTRESLPSPSLTSKHDKAWSKVLISKDHLNVLKCRGTPGPGTYGNPFPVQTRANIRFGTSQRRPLSDAFGRAPGPDYEVRTKPTDVLASTRFGKAGRFDGPRRDNMTGPGQYESKDIMDQQNLAKSFGASHRAYDHVRFPGADRLLQGKNSPGPGCFKPFNNDGQFRSFSRAAKLPADKTSRKFPGPGQYDVQDMPPPSSRKVGCYSFGKPPVKPRLDWKQLSMFAHTKWGTF